MQRVNGMQPSMRTTEDVDTLHMCCERTHTISTIITWHLKSSAVVANLF